MKHKSMFVEQLLSTANNPKLFNDAAKQEKAKGMSIKLVPRPFSNRQRLLRNTLSTRKLPSLRRSLFPFYADSLEIFIKHFFM
jgi:hypothetical protein